MNPVHLKTEVRIQAPAQDVWNGLISFPEMPHWNNHVVSAKYVTTEPFGKGTVLRVEKRRKILILTVEEAHPPLLLKLRLSHGKSRGTASFSLTQDGNSTLLEQSVTLHLAGLAPILAPVIGRNIKQELRRLQESVEHNGKR